MNFPSAQVAEDSARKVTWSTGTQLQGSPSDFRVDQLAKRSCGCVSDHDENKKGNQSFLSNSGSTIKAFTILSLTNKLRLVKMKSNVINAEGITRSLGLVLLLTSLAAAKPATYDEYFALESDVTSMESLPRGVRQPAPSVFASEIRDLLVAGNEPKKIHGKQKPFKNASGTSFTKNRHSFMVKIYEHYFVLLFFLIAASLMLDSLLKVITILS